MKQMLGTSWCAGELGKVWNNEWKNVSENSLVLWKLWQKEERAGSGRQATHDQIQKSSFSDPNFSKSSPLWFDLQKVLPAALDPKQAVKKQCFWMLLGFGRWSFHMRPHMLSLAAARAQKEGTVSQAHRILCP